MWPPTGGAQQQRLQGRYVRVPATSSESGQADSYICNAAQEMEDDGGEEGEEIG
jgi:hypothetical protein